MKSEEVDGGPATAGDPGGRAMDDFRDVKVMVTGACGFLGKRIVEGFESKGAEVVSLDLQLGHDLCDEAAVRAIFATHADARVLINAFAINPTPEQPSETMFDISLASLEQYTQVNLVAAFSCCREFARNAGDGSSIVNFSSIYGVRAPKHFIYPEGYTKHIGYTMTKAGVIGMTQYLASYLAPRIRVNAVAPGGVQANQDPDFVAKYSQVTPMGRMLERDELLGALYYLASDYASYTTGTVMNVDGGWTIW